MRGRGGRGRRPRPPVPRRRPAGDVPRRRRRGAVPHVPRRARASSSRAGARTWRPARPRATASRSSPRSCGSRRRSPSPPRGRHRLTGWAFGRRAARRSLALAAYGGRRRAAALCCCAASARSDGWTALVVPGAARRVRRDLRSLGASSRSSAGRSPGAVGGSPSDRAQRASVSLPLWHLSPGPMLRRRRRRGVGGRAQRDGLRRAPSPGAPARPRHWLFRARRFERDRRFYATRCASTAGRTASPRPARCSRRGVEAPPAAGRPRRPRALRRRDPPGRARSLARRGRRPVVRALEPAVRSRS